MAFTLPPLPYSYDALEPVIDHETMQIHHTKHHQTYIDKLNAGLESHPEYSDWSLKDLLTKKAELPDSLQAVVRNHAWGHHNHSPFWTIMKAPSDNNLPTGEIAQVINDTFWSFEAFKDKFSTTATNQFGSGWAWLVKSGESLEVIATANQDSPLMDHKTPLLGLDVWEHAYYLNYQNKRPAYIEARWSVINWEKVNELYTK